MENLNYQQLIEMILKIEKETPNDYDLGSELRKFLYKNIKTKIN